MQRKHVGIFIGHALSIPPYHHALLARPSMPSSVHAIPPIDYTLPSSPPPPLSFFSSSDTLTWINVYPVSLPGHPRNIHYSEWDRLAPPIRAKQNSMATSTLFFEKKTAAAAAAQTGHKRLHLHSPPVADKVLKLTSNKGTSESSISLQLLDQMIQYSRSFLIR
ncbi:hypothetical protein MUK42_34044 [Musa troglodytarum]|uniref:Uncharacterized protein n=1 Tax=Musa troglodytarum TaxID=320322 RepID=A0A9E7GKT4_9LILI|nr:hypothetical protein MUK42_34044 [Musa troglodytarum]